MVNKILIYLGFLLVLISCSKDISHKVDVNIIDVSNALKSEFKKIPLSSIADSISYIKLQTSEKCLVRNISRPREQIKIIGGRIFISDKTQLLSFDMLGNFITSYGSIGGGPGEFVDIRDFAILTRCAF